MNYKKIIKSQKLRLRLLKITEFIPDKAMIKLQYKIATGNKLNLKEPKRFTEKLQWYKLYYRDPLMTKCADKYRVREYIKEKGYEDILVPLYGVYNDSKEICFDKLPSKFVFKTSNGSQTNILCDNKYNLDINFIKLQLNEWLKKRTVKSGREWAYYNIKPKIICEKYLDKDENNDLIDYKFFCFNGEFKYLLVCKDRFLDGDLKKGFYDRDLNFIDIGISEYSMMDKKNKRIELKLPKNFNEMINIAENLSKDFPHVRVDLYNIREKIYFGELTFYHASGYKDYSKFDYDMGNEFILPDKKQ